MSSRLRLLWRWLPISLQAKQRIRSWFFTVLPFLFRNHPAFTAWQEHQRSLHTPFDPSDQELPAPVPLTTLPPPKDPPVRILAFYLPQYHPIAENDAWWGKGFTEWRNVIRGRPQFVGHYQPRLPGELGFYDLRVPEVQARQIELARLYGVSGFVFYFYWFAGRRLLERPLLQYLGDPRLDLPFCLCWANESWSRRWDGRERDLLITQSHSPEDDLAFIAYVSAYLRDARYIRIGGRPLLLVYRPDLLPNPMETTERWRTWCREQGIGEIFLAYTQSFEARDPAPYGFDAAVEFPPNNTAPRDIIDEVELLNPDFAGVIYDWRVYPQLSRAYRDPGYRLFRGVNPSWDNEARRPGRGAIYYGSSPSGYREWLENAIEDTLARLPERDEHLVFVNAWNEWAEGAHLEPDQRYGYAYLQATRDALAAARLRWRRSILVVSHDARPHEAQILTLSIARELSQRLGYRVQMLVLGPGPLLPEYAKCADARVLELGRKAGPVMDAYVSHLKSLGVEEAIVSSTACAPCIPPLHAAGIRVIALVHELPGRILERGLERAARIVAERADHVVFPAAQVRDAFLRFGRLPDERVVVRPQGLCRRNRFKPGQRTQARLELARRLCLDPSVQIVLGAGPGDHRRGFDLFVDVGIRVWDECPRAVFVWVGPLDPGLESEALQRIDHRGLLSRFFFPGQEPDTDLFYAGADLYALTSREDPFPTAALEALDAGLPVIAFEGAGGFEALRGSGCVDLVPAFEVDAFGAAVARLLGDSGRRERIGADARALIRRDFGFGRYVLDLLSLSIHPPPKVSVVVPNHIVRSDLPGRIGSIAAQTTPIYELIVLDDDSSDGSHEWLESELDDLLPGAQVVVNACSSRSVFERWRRGVEQARGDLVWIAEVGALAEPDFLAEATAGFSDPAVVLSFTCSQQIDDEGEVEGEDDQEYPADMLPARRHPYVVGGGEEIRSCLAIKNTIPAVSAVVFRRDALAKALARHIAEIEAHPVVGDWITYVEVLRQGRVAYCPRCLNRHRRLRGGVTATGFGRDHLKEFAAMQQRVRKAFSPDAQTNVKGLDYLGRLYQRLTLGTAESSNIQGDPDFVPYLWQESERDAAGGAADIEVSGEGGPRPSW